MFSCLPFPSLLPKIALGSLYDFIIMAWHFSHCYLLCFSAIVHETSLETIRNTMNYSLKQSAEATGKSKPTVLRALQSGRLSGKKDDNGEWQIDPAELHRVFPPVQNTDTRNDTKSSNEIGALQRELEILRDERRRDHELIEDLRHDREAPDYPQVIRHRHTRHGRPPARRQTL